jgi:hypothetical protein
MSSNSGSNGDAVPTEELHSITSDADALGCNPSNLLLDPKKERPCHLWEEVNEEDPLMQEEYVSKKVSFEGERESRNAIKGADRYKRKPEKETTQNSKKYFGSWDQERGCMTWQEVGADSDIQLEQDPVTRTYLPCVCKKESSVECSHPQNDLGFSNYSTPSLYEVVKFPGHPQQVSSETRKGRQPSIATQTWKKRLRQNQAAEIVADRNAGLERKRKVGVDLEVGFGG